MPCSAQCLSTCVCLSVPAKCWSFLWGNLAYTAPAGSQASWRSGVILGAQAWVWRCKLEEERGLWNPWSSPEARLLQPHSFPPSPGAEKWLKIILRIFLPRFYLPPLHKHEALPEHKQDVGGRRGEKSKTEMWSIQNSITVLYCGHLDRTVRDFPLYSSLPKPATSADLRPRLLFSLAPSLHHPQDLLSPSPSQCLSQVYF